MRIIAKTGTTAPKKSGPLGLETIFDGFVRENSALAPAFPAVPFVPDVQFGLPCNSGVIRV